MTTDITMMERLLALNPGDRLVYHIGDLGRDCTVRSPWRDSATRARDMAMALYKDGKVHLTQRRLGKPMTREGAIDWCNGKSEFEYIATATSKGKSK